MPGRPAGESFEVTDKGTPALNGKAIRKQVTIHLSQDPTWPAIAPHQYLPAHAKKPVPMYFDINFGAVQTAVEDPGITPQKVRDPKTNELVAPPTGGAASVASTFRIFLDAGIGVATFYYAELDPDTLTGFPHGIRAKYLKPGQAATNEARNPEDWGSIAAWAWGMSRVQDYFETDKDIDCKARCDPRRLPPRQDRHVGRSARSALRCCHCKLLAVKAALRSAIVTTARRSHISPLPRGIRTSLPPTMRSMAASPTKRPWTPIC